MIQDKERSVPRRLAAVLAVVAFLSLGLYQGSAVNLIMLCVAWAALMIACSMVRPFHLAALLAANPKCLLVIGLSFLGLAVSYQFGISPEASYPSTIAMAFLPLGFVVARIAGSEMRLVAICIAILVLCAAAYSLVPLIGNAEYAHPPFQDPNNFAQLIYLVLIPGVHGYLVRQWGDRPLTIAWHGLFLTLMFLLLIALFSTQSRAALAVVVVAAVIWLGLSVWKRQSVGPWLVCVAVGVFAFGMSNVLLEGGVGDRLSDRQIEVGVELRGALTESSFEMLVDHPPVSGIGISAFPILYKHYRSDVDQYTKGLFAHNDYFQLLLEGGLLLAVALLALVGFAGVGLVRSLLFSPRAKGFAFGGTYMAICALIAHAAITFVFYVPALALLVGLMAGLPWAANAPMSPALLGEKADPRYVSSAAIVALGFGWLCWGYLCLDTYSAGVFGGQRGVPWSAETKQDPDAMLRYARFAQALNGDRETPILAEAVLLEQQLNHEPESAYLQERSLDAYRRAARVGPWNVLIPMQMSRMVDNHPQLQPHLTAAESPEGLLLKAQGIDPFFTPVVDALVTGYLANDRRRDAFVMLRTAVLPWLQFFARESPEAAIRYFKLLEEMAVEYDDQFVLGELQKLRDA